MLTEAEIAQFRTDGWLVVEDALDPARLAAVRAEYEGLLDRLCAGWTAEGRLPPLRPGTGPDGAGFFEKLRAAYEAGCDWFQPMDISLPGGPIAADTPFHFGPAVFEMVRAPRILDVVESLIGGEITSNPIQHVRIKPPAARLRPDEARAHITRTDWHQDRAVALESADDTDMVTVWLAITDATVDNGCLQVIPGLPGMLAHCPLGQTAIPARMLDTARAIPLPVKAGSAILFHPLTPHSSLPNVSNRFRWSFDLRYNRTGQPTGRDHFPGFVARSRANPSSELTDWRAWAGMWEEARTRLAQQDHIPIHRWTSESPACA